MANLLGIVAQLGTLLGFNCNPINVIGGIANAGQCKTTPVCCSQNPVVRLSSAVYRPAISQTNICSRRAAASTPAASPSTFSKHTLAHVDAPIYPSPSSLTLASPAS